MTARLHELEQTLCDAYERQASRYREALVTGQVVVDAFAQGRDTTRDLEHLQAGLDDVAAMDSEIREIRRQWDATGQQPSDRLRAAVKQLESLLKQLIENIHHAEQQARQARERLVPELNHEARSQQMRAAYGDDE